MKDNLRYHTQDQHAPSIGHALGDAPMGTSLTPSNPLDKSTKRRKNAYLFSGKSPQATPLNYHYPLSLTADDFPSPRNAGPIVPCETLELMAIFWAGVVERFHGQA